MKNGLNIYYASEVESEQGEGYDEQVFIVARTEESAFNKFEKYFNKCYTTYLYYWNGCIEDNFDEKKCGDIYEWLEGKSAGIYFKY